MRDFLRRNAANAVTVLRFFAAAGLVCCVPLSRSFWGWYLLGGVSDMLDGPIARALRQQSEAGARLDSLADLAFCAVALFRLAGAVSLPLWAWGMAGLSAVLRLTAWAVGWQRTRTFSPLHTALNKTAGLLLFAFPLLCVLLGVNGACVLTGSAAVLSAGGELAATAAGKRK